MKPQTLRFQRYIVAGCSQFPIGMLYLDECFPLTPEDAKRMLEKPSNDDNYIQLGRFVTNKKNQPRVRSWNKFGWRVVKYSVQTM